eukprot:m51a1_g3547 hypothetical protein (671) ;mRNA; f:994765-997138
MDDIVVKASHKKVPGALTLSAQRGVLLWRCNPELNDEPVTILISACRKLQRSNKSNAIRIETGDGKYDFTIALQGDKDKFVLALAAFLPGAPPAAPQAPAAPRVISAAALQQSAVPYIPDATSSSSSSRPAPPAHHARRTSPAPAAPSPDKRPTPSPSSVTSSSASEPPAKRARAASETPEPRGSADASQTTTPATSPPPQATASGAATPAPAAEAVVAENEEEERLRLESQRKLLDSEVKRMAAEWRNRRRKDTDEQMRLVRMEAEKAREDRRRRALEDAGLAAAKNALLRQGAVSEEEFWRTARPGELHTLAPLPPRGDPRPVRTGGRIVYNLSGEDIRNFLRRIPGLKEAYERQVPAQKSAAQFWKDFIVERYHSAAAAGGAAGGAAPAKRSADIEPKLLVAARGQDVAEDLTTEEANPEDVSISELASRTHVVQASQQFQTQQLQIQMQQKLLLNRINQRAMIDIGALVECSDDHVKPAAVQPAMSTAELTKLRDLLEPPKPVFAQLAIQDYGAYFKNTQEPPAREWITEDPVEVADRVVSNPPKTSLEDAVSILQNCNYSAVQAALRTHGAQALGKPQQDEVDGLRTVCGEAQNILTEFWASFPIATKASRARADAIAVVARSKWDAVHAMWANEMSQSRRVVMEKVLEQYRAAIEASEKTALPH